MTDETFNDDFFDGVEFPIVDDDGSWENKELCKLLCATDETDLKSMQSAEAAALLINHPNAPQIIVYIRKKISAFRRREKQKAIFEEDLQRAAEIEEKMVEERKKFAEWLLKIRGGGAPQPPAKPKPKPDEPGV